MPLLFIDLRAINLLRLILLPSEALEINDLPVAFLPLLVSQHLPIFLLLVTADEITEGPDDPGEGVDLIGNGDLEPLIDLPFKLPDLFLVLPVFLTSVRGGVIGPAVPAVEERELAGGIPFQVGLRVEIARFELLHI